MKDLIERQAAIDAIGTWDKFGADERGRIVRWHEGLVIYVRLRDVLTAIVNLPAAQPDVIRCKNCRFQDKGSNESESWNLCGYRPWLHVPTEDEHYCGYAERRTDE